jgi:hypothetical protein
MVKRVLRHESRRLVRDLVSANLVPSPFSVQQLCVNLAAARGRALHVLPLPVPAAVSGACGLWLATDDADFILVEEATTPLHHDHIVLHEIGHMLGNHTRKTNLATQLREQGPLSELSPDLVRHIFARANYTTAEEQIAETVADLVEEYGLSRPPKPLGTGGMGRLEEALGAQTEAGDR